MFRSVTIKKNILENEPMTGTVVSEAIPAKRFILCGFQVVWTGAPTGSFYIERSIDGLNWKDSGVEFSNPAGSAGGDFPEIKTVAPYVRLKYIHGSGTGNMSFHLVGSTRN